MIIYFTKPDYLLLLGLIPLVILTHFFMLKRKRVFALRFANFDALARVKGIDLLSKNIVVLVITITIIILLSFSLSGTTINRVLYSSSTSFVIAIDTSGSMEAADIPPNRLDAAKESAEFFIDSVPPGTRIGVISFSGNAFIEQEITSDLTLAKQAIKRISLSSIGGSDLGEAVITSSNLLSNEEAKSIILISDGRINVGTIEDLIDYAIKNNVIVHTIGIGTEEGGETTYGLSRIDEDALTSIAFNTNGRFFKVDSKDALEQSFVEILNLKIKEVPFDLSKYLTLAALVLFAIEYILVNTRYRVLP